MPTQNPADGGGRDGQIMRDLRAGQELPTQGDDGRLRLGRGRPVQAAGPGGAILQPGGAFGFKARDPLANRLETHAQLRNLSFLGAGRMDNLWKAHSWEARTIDEVRSELSRAVE